MDYGKLKKYEADYSELPFEDILREYRQQNVIKILTASPHKNILEIGCGSKPLFLEFDDFEKMVLVEPLKTFYAEVAEQAGSDPRIFLINDFFENSVEKLMPQTFDFIIVGGFLHEIHNPCEVLQAIKKVCSSTTIVHSFVPNAHSFHRLLAWEMGIIENVYEKSGHDEMFERFHVYNTETFNDLFAKNGFSISECGTYFIKPLAHTQMHEMLAQKIIDKSVIDGLNKMIKYFPQYGAEIYINCNIQP